MYRGKVRVAQQEPDLQYAGTGTECNAQAAHQALRSVVTI